MSTEVLRMDEIVCDRIPRFPAPPGGRLADDMVRAYREAGVIVLEDFVSVESCERLRRRALELGGDGSYPWLGDARQRANRLEINQ